MISGHSTDKAENLHAAKSEAEGGIYQFFILQVGMERYVDSEFRFEIFSLITHLLLQSQANHISIYFDSHCLFS
jgi:hypothetical protein